jgi:hypothetical protein
MVKVGNIPPTSSKLLELVRKAVEYVHQLHFVECHSIIDSCRIAGLRYKLDPEKIRKKFYYSEKVCSLEDHRFLLDPITDAALVSLLVKRSAMHLSTQPHDVYALVRKLKNLPPSHSLSNWYSQLEERHT